MIAAIVCVVLLWITVEDLLRFRIPNAAILMLVGAYLLHCFFMGGMAACVPHLALGAFGLALMVGAFWLGVVGGGDAKLMAAALLWTGPEGAFVFALLLTVFTLLYGIGARLGALRRRVCRGRTMIPFGPCIAAAWLGAMALSALP